MTPRLAWIHAGRLLPARRASWRAEDALDRLPPRAPRRSAATAASTSAAVVSRDSEKRSTPVRSSTPIAFKVALGPAVLDAQADPADASTPRASSACSSGSAGSPGNASEAMCGARGAPVTVGRAPGTGRQRGRLQPIAQRRHGRVGPGVERPAPERGGAPEADQRRQVLGAPAQPALLAAAVPERLEPRARAAPRARPRPSGRAACGPRAPACRRPARAAAGAGGRTPARRRRAGAGGASSAGPSARAISATGWTCRARCGPA